MYSGETSTNVMDSSYKKSGKIILTIILISTGCLPLAIYSIQVPIGGDHQNLMLAQKVNGRHPSSQPDRNAANENAAAGDYLLSSFRQKLHRSNRGRSVQWNATAQQYFRLGCLRVPIWSAKEYLKI